MNATSLTNAELVKELRRHATFDHEYEVILHEAARRLSDARGAVIEEPIALPKSKPRVSEDEDGLVLVHWRDKEVLLLFSDDGEITYATRKNGGYGNSHEQVYLIRALSHPQPESEKRSLNDEEIALFDAALFSSAKHQYDISNPTTQKDGISEEEARRRVELETIADTIQQWLDWASRNDKAEGFVRTDETQIYSLPTNPSVGMFKNWIAVLRQSASRQGEK